MSLDQIAREYVKLAFSLTKHDEGYVDLYFGPPELRADAEGSPKSLATIRADAERLLSDLEDLATESDRSRWLRGQLQAVIGRIDVLQGATESFDEETRKLYGLVAPTFSDDFFEDLLSRIDALIPGKGPLQERYRAHRLRFNVPSENLPATLDAALSMATARTRAALPLPMDRQSSVAYVTSKPFHGYLWYHGDYRSTFELNTDAPLRVSDVLDLACHEAYPGHHVQFCLAEQILFRERGWVEFTVSTLFTPRRLFYDGLAMYGVHLVLPGDEQKQFERDVLFPCAGLDPATAPEYHAVRSQTRQLFACSVEAGRRLLDGRFDEAQCMAWLQRYALVTKEHAEMHITFYNRYRSAYVQYIMGYDIVRHLIEAGRANSWDRFYELLLAPGLPQKVVC